ncbi:MAG: aldo/keto reductase [Pseudomonadota bacterium]
MKMNELGRTGMQVTSYCLGTMTFGTQTDEPDAHRQLDMALDAGINFLDTAEMYPVNPIRPETVGRTEEIIGNWIAKSGRRDDYIIATKHSGEGSFVRDGAPISSKTIATTIEGNLKRLQTDHIDLYQFHWPNRGSYMFRKNWSYDPSGLKASDIRADMLDCLEALQKEVDRGTIRAFGLSNESAWGTAQWLRLAEENGLPRVASVQNEYSLMCRAYDTDMAEMSVAEDVGLLAFSPLAAGYLTGKYAGGSVPAGSRMDINGTLGGRKTDRADVAAQAYVDLAAKHGLDPVHMALAWCDTRPFMCANIFGASSTAQLELILAGLDLSLSAEVVDALDELHKAHPMPY